MMDKIRVGDRWRSTLTGAVVVVRRRIDSRRPLNGRGDMLILVVCSEANSESSWVIGESMLRRRYERVEEK